jgi:TetR/AcrR family transcriptional regulator, repressor of fatR-cypB operon
VVKNAAMNSLSKGVNVNRPRISDKRSAILRAALDLFAEGGVNGVPMPVVAQVAGVGTGTVYRYFASKEELVNELFREQKNELSKRLYADLDKATPAQQQFAIVWQRMIDFAREQPASFRFMELQDHRPYLDDASRDLERKILGPSLAHYRSMQEKGIYRQDIRPEVLMTMVWGSCVGLIKSERDGHITLSQADVDAACHASWDFCTA